MSNTTALAKRDPNPLVALRQQWPEEHYNTLLPRVHIGSLPAGTQLAVREVKIDPNETGMYSVDGGKRALGKQQLSRIAAAAGLTWVSVRRVDDRKHPHYCEFEAIAKVTDFDGTVREAIGTKTIDLRDDGGDGTPGKDKVGMSEKQLGGARKFISEMCAAKAMNRAIADVLAIRRSYTPQDLVKPFIVPKLVPDTSNELAQRAVLANMFGATQAMFAPPATVVDAHFEDVATATPAASDEAAGEVRGGSLPSPAADTSIPHDPRTGEVRGSESIDARMSAAWGLFERAGGARDDFRGLVQAATGKSRKSDLTLDDAELVERAVDAAVANMDNSGDDVAY